MFVNVTHPSQIRDRKVQRTIKAFTSAHNQRRKRADRKQEVRDDTDSYPDTPCSTDEDKASASSRRNEVSASSTGLCGHHDQAPSDPSQQPPEENREVEELRNHSQVGNRNLLRLGRGEVETSLRQKPEEIQELYPATGNITPPFSEAGLSVQTNARLRRLTQYYIEVDGPTTIWRSQQLAESSKVDIFKRNFFALSMTEPIIIETIFAGSQLRLDWRDDPHAKPSPMVLQHRSKVLKMIQERIMNTKTMLDDATFFAIMGMITLDDFCGNWNSFKRNLDGFRILVALRGGTENLGWFGWFQTHLGWAELRWASYIAKNKLNMFVNPTYPRHPFPSALSTMISKLPVGLREAAVSRKLSIEVLDFLHNLNKWTTRYEDEMEGKCYLEGLRLTARAARLMGKYDISRAERILCIGTFAYIIETDGGRKETRVPRGLEDHLVGIEMLHSGLSFDESLLWAGVVIAASNDVAQVPSVIKWALLDRILDADRDGDLSKWEDVQKRLRRFFWNGDVEKTWQNCWKTAMERRKKAITNNERGNGVSTER